MDTVTHAVVGALLGKAFFAAEPSRASVSWREPPKNASRIAILACAAGAMFPDIDIVAGQLAHNRLALMTWHRGITHSVIMLPVWAVVLAALTWWFARRIRWPAPAFSDLTAVYLVAIGSHIFMDVITSFGTMVWAPLNHSRISWDFVAIVDLTFGNVLFRYGRYFPPADLHSARSSGRWIFLFRRAHPLSWRAHWLVSSFCLCATIAARVPGGSNGAASEWHWQRLI